MTDPQKVISQGFSILDEGVSIIFDWVDETELQETIEKSALLAYTNISLRLVESIYSIRLLLQNGLMRSSIPILRHTLKLALTFRYLLICPQDAILWCTGTQIRPKKMIQNVGDPTLWREIYSYLSELTHTNMEKDNSLLEFEENDKVAIVHYKIIIEDIERIQASIIIIILLVDEIFDAIEQSGLPKNLDTAEYYVKMQKYIIAWISTDETSHESP